jgi:DNA polymerase III subunit alpha
MERHFTHLHLHTDYSLLDGAIPIDRLIAFGKENALKALAITDHGNVFGAVKFFSAAKQAGIKPVLGMEAYLAEDAHIKDVQNKYYHLILLVQNATGYANLCKLIHYAYTTGFYFKPRIDYAMLAAHQEGLIVTTACLGGHIPQLLMQDRFHEADAQVDWFLKVFGTERFFLEVQPDEQRDQKVLNEKIFTLAQRKSVGVVAAGDCHYVTPQDREAHEIMLSIQTHHQLTDPDRFTFGECRVHIRTVDEMLAIFKDHEEVVWQSGTIADRCTFEFQTGKLFFPQCEVPVGETAETYFRHLCNTGLQQLRDKERIGSDDYERYQQRLDLEIELIIRMGFVGYFLVVSDFIGWAHQQKIPVGPGRGSVAGSLVAWALHITDIDPLRYNLLFERFLNPERISMPDIDIDFCIEGRELVINYVRQKYGHDKVCQIITFGTMLAKGVIKDVARALGFTFEDAQALTELIPDQLKITLREAFEQEPKLKELADKNAKVAHLFDSAFRLEGLTRHASKHAAGIVISPEPISGILPVYIPPKTTELVTQYAMTELETLGFLKMDFLGLKNLTLIKRVIELIEKGQGITLDVTRLSLDDAPTFLLLCEGKTSGVFQLESDGIKDVLRRLQPNKFEDIIAVNALYRPGPLGSGMVDDFIERRHGRQPISYIFAELASILEETYGVIVYQEQVMKIASAIGGYSLGEADILRRAMGKKKAEEMAKQQSIFVSRARTRGFDEAKAQELFDLMAYFAGYGFNKSHSAAYALIAYQTAYLKANYPAEFMACLVSLESGDADKMAFYIQEAKDRGIAILPPDIMKSQLSFSVEEGKLRFGLQGIRNVGDAVLHDIFIEREKKAFKDIYDICLRIDMRTCNKRVMESLICAGAFDTLPGTRSQQYEELPLIMERAAERKKAKLTGQMGLFDSGAVTTDNDEEPLYVFQPRDEWSDAIKLEKEKEVLGIYVTAQPLDSYNIQSNWLPFKKFKEMINKQGDILCCGVVRSVKEVTTKTGDKMAFVAMEDRSGNAEVVLFPKIWARVAPLLDMHMVFIVKGILGASTDQLCKIKAHDLIPFDVLLQEGRGVEKMIIGFASPIDEQILEEMKTVMTPGTIMLEFFFTEGAKRLSLVSRTKISLTASLCALLVKHKLEVRIKLA